MLFMELFARHDLDTQEDQRFQVQRPCPGGGIRAALRQSFKPADLPPDLATLLTRLR